jgi:hypothetical protein
MCKTEKPKKLKELQKEYWYRKMRHKRKGKTYVVFTQPFMKTL